MMANVDDSEVEQFVLLAEFKLPFGKYSIAHFTRRIGESELNRICVL